MKNIISVSALAASAVLATAVLAQTAPPATSPTTPPAVVQPTPAMPTPSAATPSMADPFYTTQLTAANWRSTEIVGKSVYSRQDERIGEVDELVLNAEGRVVAAVVGVGGFLGVGERKVALSFPALKMTRDSGGIAKINVDLSKETLNAAPAYMMPKAN